MATNKKKSESKRNIDNRNYEAAKADSKESIRSAAAYNPGFQKFTQVTGVEDKAKVVIESVDAKGKDNIGKHAFGRKKARSNMSGQQDDNG